MRARAACLAADFPNVRVPDSEAIITGYPL